MNKNNSYIKKVWRSLAISVFSLLTLSACSSLFRLTSANMDKLELGMSKEQIVNIIGTGYTIAEKRMENGNQIEVLAYKDYAGAKEIYMFVLKNNRLEEWYMKLLPQYEVKE